MSTSGSAVNPLLVMPIAGLSYLDVSRAALECDGNRIRTARRLGVGTRSLDAAIDRAGLHNWFVRGRGRGVKVRQRCVSREQVEAVRDEGWLRADAAHILGISVGYLRDLSELWSISWAADRGRKSQIGKRGYCG